MTWLVPAGFLALLALPVLVVLRLAGARRRAHRVGALLLWAQAAEGLPRGTGRALPPLPLLLLEAGAVAAIGLAVAHPAWVDEAPALNVLVVVDRTASMDAVAAEGTTAWQRGLQQLEARLAELPPATSYSVRAVPPLLSGALEGPRDAVLAVLRTATPDPNGAGDAAGAIGGDFHRYLLVTDHLPKPAGRDSLEVIATGAPGDNAAVTALRRTAQGWFAVVANHSDAPLTASLQLLRGGAEVVDASVSCAPGRMTGVVMQAPDGPREGAVTARLSPQHADVLRSDDALSVEANTAGSLTVAWIGPESPALLRAIAAATGRTVVIADADGDPPGLTVCHRTVPQPLPSGAVLVVDPAADAGALGWQRRAFQRDELRAAGPHAATWSRMELLQRLPAATGCAPGLPPGAVTHLAGDGAPAGSVVWSAELQGQRVAVVGLPPEGGWELSPGYPIFWARIVETLIDTGTASHVVERDAAESDLRNAVTAHRRGTAASSDAPVLAATAASGRPWLVLIALALLAWRLRRRP